MKLLRGAPLAAEILSELKKQVGELREKPTLVVLVVGQNLVNRKYLELKQERAKAVGIAVKLIELGIGTTTEKLVERIEELNDDGKISGIIVQLPLPEHIKLEKIVWAIDRRKDVDGFRFQDFTPPAALAVTRLLAHYHLSLKQLRYLIVGEGFLVGRPLALLLTKMGARVDIARPGDRLSDKVRRADVIVCAVGRANLIKPEILSPHQVVIDCGTSEQAGKLVGDIDFVAVKNKVAALTSPVGGIGPLTLALLLQNVVTAAQRGE